MINTVTSFSSIFFLKITFFFSMNVDVYPADSCIYFEKKPLHSGNYFTCENFHVLVIESRIYKFVWNRGNPSKQ